MQSCQNVFGNEQRKAQVISLHRNIYGIEEAAKIWHQTLVQEFASLELNEMRAAPRIFTEKKLIFICYVDELVTFAESPYKSENF